VVMSVSRRSPVLTMLLASTKLSVAFPIMALSVEMVMLPVLKTPNAVTRRTTLTMMLRLRASRTLPTLPTTLRTATLTSSAISVSLWRCSARASSLF
jgi:hypothetical protein